jgi:hypothetical protein
VEALAERARLQMLAGKKAEAVELADDGIELAERLGLERQLASLLITRGTAAGSSAEIERGLELAEQLKDLRQLSRGLNNLATTAASRGDIPAALATYARHRREFEGLGLPGYVRWLDIQEASVLSVTREWDRALELLDAILVSDDGEPGYLEASARSARARMRHARGDTTGALADAEHAAAAARAASDPQLRVPTLGWTAGIFAREGRRAEARALMAEALAYCRKMTASYYTLASALLSAALDVGAEREFADAFAPFASDDPWTGAAVAGWRGDLLGAADLYSSCGGELWEADLRTRAAARLLAEGDVAAASRQLGRALDYYRSVDAIRYVWEAEQMLASAAS